MNWKPAKVVHVGIDPGVNVGFALSYAGKLLQLSTLSFWEVVAELEALAEGAQLHVYIENPNANKPTFHKAAAESQKAREKISQNVGSNKRDAQLLIEKVERLGVTVLPVRPINKKLSADLFRKVSGWEGSCSQHARDAAMLILGR